jgi:aryl carrier-like protein
VQIDNKNLLRLYLVDILKGYSKTYLNDKLIYIKHMDSVSSGDVDLKKEEFYHKALKNKLPSLADQEAYILKEELWSEEKNKEIKKIKEYITGLKKTKLKLFREQELKAINEQITNEEKKLLNLSLEKKELIGFTAEDYANKKINEYYMFISLYKDTELKENFFSQNEFDELENVDITKLVQIYNDKLSIYNDKNLKKISLLNSHLTLFNISDDNPYYMYGKSIVYLTFYQIEIFGYAKYFKNQLSYAKHKPADEYFEDPEKLIEWLESSKNVEELLEKGASNKADTVATSIIGATKEDLKKAGLDESNTISLTEEAKKRGGTLSMEDLMKLHGI